MQVKTFTRSAGIAAAITTGAHAAFVGPSAYLSAADSPFAGLGLPVFLNETFEDGALNTPGLSASIGFVTGPSAFTDSVDGDAGPIDGLGQSGRAWYSGGIAGDVAITFGFDAGPLGGLPTHAGLVWTDVGTVSSGSFGVGVVSFEAFDALGVSLGVLGPFTLGDGLIGGESSEDRFFGVTHLGGISRITITTANSTDWEVDHVQYGIIPAPGAVGLLGLAAALTARRRR